MVPTFLDPQVYLPLGLPPFTRVAWASDLARDVWGTRIQRVRTVLRELEWQEVRHDVRPCAHQRMETSDYHDLQRQLLAVNLDSEILPKRDERTVAAADVGIAKRSDDLTSFRSAFANSDESLMGRLLGYPQCCVKAFEARFATSLRVDPIWTISIDSSSAHPSPGNGVMFDSSACSSVIWRYIGISSISHLPCSFSCSETSRLSVARLELGRRLGFASELEWLCDMLSWPVEWSALHGIAEIKTPILKISTRTDSTASKYVIGILGSTYPIEGARGLSFPYSGQTPNSLDSPGFRRGLNNALALTQIDTMKDLATEPES